MKSSQFNQILALVRQTHDRIVVADSESDEVFVVMPLAEYQALEHSSSLQDDAFFETSEHAKDLAVENDAYISHISYEEPKKKPSRFAQKQSKRISAHDTSLNFDENWSEGGTVFDEEMLDDVLEEEVEERFYLEPIES